MVDEGCVALMPEELSTIEQAGLLVFQSVADTWTMRGGGFSEETLGWFRMDMAQKEAEGLGLAWTPQLHQQVRRCVGWFRKFWNDKREERRKLADKFAKNKKEMVN